ncbi:ubiquitin-protein ligase molybdopterin-converting factor [Pseudohyphozyma bogoriensis]|nr:ubiquitin-protein ligase molybdopterin-converting factor [Pseudohyphozyma bogoriensis]
MSSFYSRADSWARTSTGKLVLVALAASAITTTTVLSSQALRRKVRRHNLRDQIESTLNEDGEDEMTDFTRGLSRRGSVSTGGGGAGGKGRKGGKKTNEVIIRESLARNYVFFGDEGMEKIRGSFVVVVGLGGVGSAAATMLVRSGVGKIRLIDFDQVSLSSLNRHSTATLAQVGTPKVTSCAEYYESVAPWVEVDPRIELFGKDMADELFEGNPDYVVDCIDNIDSKIELLHYCHSRNIPVFSSLGAASKSDPSMIQISDISCTFEDPLARSVRRRLKLLGVHSGVPVVYSTEKPRPEIALLPLPDEEFEKGKVGELSAIANFRVRILPVLGPLPAMFGNAAATYVLQQLAGFKCQPLPVKNRRKAAASIYRQLSIIQEKLTGSNKLPISEDDCLYLFEELHRSRSVVPPHIPPAKPVLLPWNKRNGMELDNLVLFDREESLKHEEKCVFGDEDPEEVWGSETAEVVRRRQGEEKRLRKYRL